MDHSPLLLRDGRTAMASLSELVDKMADRYDDPPGGEGYKKFLAPYSPSPKAYGHRPPEAVKADIAATEELMRLAQPWTAVKYPLSSPEIPQPRTHLRQMPPL